MESVKAQYISVPQDNNFYRQYYHYVIIGVMVIVFIMLTAVCVILYQIFHRPLPVFYAVQADGQRMLLTANENPNLLPDTVLRWASKAATTAYTFDFVNYRQQINAARPFFTNAGWRDYQNSVQDLLSTIVQNKLFVNGVVSGTPVISNQGPLPDKGYSWRIQIPFLVTYQSANTTSKRSFIVVLTLVQVPTNVNPQGIGVDQFVMT